MRRKHFHLNLEKGTAGSFSIQEYHFENSNLPSGPDTMTVVPSGSDATWIGNQKKEVLLKFK